MQYDLIKNRLGRFFNQSTFLRILFYRLLDLLLLRAWHIKRELRKIKRDLGEQINVLDAGSGFGQYTYYMSKLSDFWNIKGIDVKPEQIEDCNEFFNKIDKSQRVRFETSDLLQFSEKDSYHLILCVDVMEHILDDVQVFSNYSYSLKNGGVLLMSTPSDQGGSDVHNPHNKSFIDEHVRDGYNINEIREKLKKAGFSAIEVRYSYGPPGKISWKISMKYPIIMLNTSKLFNFILPLYYLITFPFALIMNILDVNLTHKTGTGLIVKAIK